MCTVFISSHHTHRTNSPMPDGVLSTFCCSRAVCTIYTWWREDRAVFVYSRALFTTHNSRSFGVCVGILSETWIKFVRSFPCKEVYTRIGPDRRTYSLWANSRTQAYDAWMCVYLRVCGTQCVSFGKCMPDSLLLPSDIFLASVEHSECVRALWKSCNVYRAIESTVWLRAPFEMNLSGIYVEKNFNT